MVSRRQVIGSGLAAPALALLPRVTHAIPAARRDGRYDDLAFVVVDERFDAARALAHELFLADRASRTRCLALPRDVLDLWHSKLAPACVAGNSAFAGVTTGRGFFMLRTLAADHRLRVRSRTSHQGLVSFIIGP